MADPVTSTDRRGDPDGRTVEGPSYGPGRGAPAENDFGDFAALLDYPVYVVTAAGREPAGCLVGFAGQCSIRPARFVVWVSKANHTHAVALAAEVLAVHLLPHDHRLAELFGGRTGDDTDKFARVEWYRGPHGAPILAEAPAWFVGRVLDRADWGDHTGLLLAPVVVHTPPGAVPVSSFRDVADIEAGHPA
ncbi:flavin reductase family protein [Kitasatospora sp. Ki12]|uniref:flavin reductase family protein n=1 Tax=Kitasatospora xanthocidica TaxID=83382 RepID=UPI00167872BB|nr:flavin reductase family protein [Kitasatospora xanthocidica]GHF38692.1 oxidoreductase [Kitasatospora xanthocidica]